MKNVIQTLLNRSKRILQSDLAFRRIIFNSSWLLSGNTLATFLMFMQGIIVARTLGVEQYGILTLITTYATTVNQFVDSRSWETAIKFVMQYTEQNELGRATATVKLSYLIDAVTGVLAFLLIIFTARLAADIFIKEMSAVGLIQLYAFMVLISIPSGTCSALLRIGDRFDWLAYYNTGEAALRLGGVLIVNALRAGISEMLWVYLLTKAVGIIVLLILSWRVGRELNLLSWWQAPLKLLSGQYRRVLGFAALSNLGATSRLITSRADILILGWLANPVSVGLYRLAKQLANVLTVGISPLYTAIYPELSRLVAQGKFKEIRSLQSKLSTTIVAAVVPMSLFFTVAVIWFIPFVFGQEYSASIILAQILVWQIVWMPLIWLPGWLLSIEKTRLLATLNWVDAGLYVILLIIFILNWDVVGAALATTIRFVMWAVMAILVVIYVNQGLQRPFSEQLT